MKTPLRAVSTEEAGNGLQPHLPKKDVTLGKRQDEGQAHTGLEKPDHASSQHQETTYWSAWVEADVSPEEGVVEATEVRGNMTGGAKERAPVFSSETQQSDTWVAGPAV